MEERNEYWLNDYGERYWHRKDDISMTAHRSYYWVDRVSFIHEKTTHYVKEKKIWSTGDRLHVGKDKTFTDFKNELDDWVPILDFWEYTRILNKYYRNKDRIDKINKINNETKN